MDQNEFKLRQALLGENGVVARFHQQITEARQPNIPHVYVVINRQRIKISKAEISRWLRSTAYFKHLSHLKTDNQFLEAVYNDPSRPQLAQRPERVLSPNVINTLVAMTHLNEPDQEKALKEMVDQEEEAKGRLDYVPDRNETVNQALKTQLEIEKQSDNKKNENKEEPSRKIAGGSTKPPQQSETIPNHVEAGEVNLDRTDLHIQRIISTQPPSISAPHLPRQPLFRRITNNLSSRNAPSFLKNISSKVQILASRALRSPLVTSTLISGLAGGAIGFGVTGTAQGAVIGGLGFGSLPLAAKSGALRGAFGLGTKGAAGLAGRGGLAAAGLATGPAGWAALAASLAPNVKSWAEKYGKWLIAGILVFLFLFLVLIPMNLLKTNSLFPPFKQDISNSPNSDNKVILSKRGTEAIANGGIIEYQITATFQGKGRADITITDKVPDTTEFQDINEGGSYQKSGDKTTGGTVQWRLSNILAGSSKTLQFRVKATSAANNTWVVNQAEANLLRVSNDSTPPLQIIKTADKSSVSVGNTIEFNIRVKGTYAVGEKVTVEDKIPEFTTLVSKDNAAELKGDTLQWVLAAEKISRPPHPRYIPSPTGKAPDDFGYSVQQISTTVDKLAEELAKNTTDPNTKANARHFAEIIFKASVGDGSPEQIVDPAFVAAIWYKESNYQSEGLGYENNPGTFVWSQANDGQFGGIFPNKDGVYTGIQYGKDDRERQFGRFDTIEIGLAAIPQLIRQAYYKRGQTNTWTIHSGIDEKTGLQYHGRSDIGKSYTDIANWDKYLEFYFGWIDTMDRLFTGVQGLDKELKFTVKADQDKKWIVNRAQGKSATNLSAQSKTVVIKVGDAPESERPKTGTDYVASCTFSRGGQTGSIKSSKLASYIEEVADKTGVPASVLASVAMHENQGFLTGADDKHDAFGDSISTSSACTHFNTSAAGALGLMQVIPPQSILPTARADAYDERGVKLGAEFAGKSLNTLTLKDFCDIKTNLYLGAGVLISKNNGRPPQNSQETQKAGCGYFGSPPNCTFGGFNYGDEVQKDYDNCQPPTASGSAGGIVCPIPQAKISCGPSKPNTTAYGSCQDGGHCAGSYGSPDWCKYPGTAYAADISGPAGTQVYLPLITDPTTKQTHSLTCSYQGEAGGDFAGDVERIQQFDCQDDVDGKRVWIQFHHTVPGSGPKESRIFKSGDPVAGKVRLDHVHVQIGINGGCGADSRGCVAADKYLQCN